MELHNVIFVTNEGVLDSWNELKMASKLKFGHLYVFVGTAGKSTSPLTALLETHNCSDKVPLSN